MIITTSTIMLVQAVIVTWVMMTASEPCPHEYIKLEYKELIKVCKLHYYDYGRTGWVLREE